ncbi:MAG: PH domain-containing protein [Methylococcaceae bacterium]|nr:PH domain-containing protein [Methylococcaceae bacterium]MCI0733432.1 PH domain-containing protein [Methylococcaceae bacterium]
MGIIDALLGNATIVDLDKLDEDFAPILAESESIQLGYRVVRDVFVFTNRRLILVDKQGLTAKRVLFRSIPYLSIAYFEVETKGYFDIDAELRIWISGNPDPIVKDLKNKDNVIAIQKALARFILG